jgi:hypothetical protein
LPRLGSRVRIPSPAPVKSQKNQPQRCIFDGGVQASISLNKPGTVPGSLADLGKRRAERSRNVPDGPPPKQSATSAETKPWGPREKGRPSGTPGVRWMLIGSPSDATQAETLVPPSPSPLSQTSHQTQRISDQRGSSATSRPSITVDTLGERTTAKHGITGREVKRLNGATHFMAMVPPTSWRNTVLAQVNSSLPASTMPRAATSSRISRSGSRNSRTALTCRLTVRGYSRTAAASTRTSSSSVTAAVP